MRFAFHYIPGHCYLFATFFFFFYNFSPSSAVPCSSLIFSLSLLISLIFLILTEAAERLDSVLILNLLLCQYPFAFFQPSCLQLSLFSNILYATWHHPAEVKHAESHRLGMKHSDLVVNKCLKNSHICNLICCSLWFDPQVVEVLFVPTLVVHIILCCFNKVSTTKWLPWKHLAFVIKSQLYIRVGDNTAR